MSPLRYAAMFSLSIWACSAVAAAPNSVADPAITILDAYAPASMIGSMMGVGFMKITNHSASDCDLVGASSSVSKSVELHEHQNDNGVMKMRQVKKVTIAKDHTIAFAPGGLHLMLIDLNGPLIPNQTFNVSLDFGACGKVVHSFAIKPQS